MKSATTASKRFAWQDVKAEREIVVAKLALRFGEQLHGAEQPFIAGFFGGAFTVGDFEEDIFAGVISETNTVNRVATKIFDAKDAGVNAYFKIFTVDAGRFDGLWFDLWLDQWSAVIRTVICTGIAVPKQ